MPRNVHARLIDVVMWCWLYCTSKITLLSVLASCDQSKTLSGEFTLCIGPKSFQVYRNVMSHLHFQTWI